jgi:UDP-N-acetylglucosamine 3-dehydrogenase
MSVYRRSAQETRSDLKLVDLMNMIKVAVAGLGRQGMLHLMNCYHIDDVQVVAAADKSMKARSKAKSLGVENLYEEYEKMLKSHTDLDAVILSMPNFLHLSSIQLALEAGLDIFTEKPLANTASECQQIVNLTQKSGRKLMIGHNCRFYDMSEKMKQQLDEGLVGDVEVVTAEEVINGPFAHPYVPSPVSEWWFDPKKSGGGALLDVGYHMIDLFRFFAGDARVLHSYLGHRLNLAIEDTAILLLQSVSSNAKGIINVGWYERTVFPRFDFRVVLHGNAGYLSSEDLVPKSIYRHAMKVGLKNILSRVVGRKITPLRYTYFYDSYYRELKHFFDCVKTDSEPSVSAEDGLRTIETIEEAYRKAEKATQNGKPC